MLSRSSPNSPRLRWPWRNLILPSKSRTRRAKLDKLIAADRANIDAMLIAADLEVTAGTTAAAIARYRSLLEVDQDNVHALNNLAYLTAKEDPDGALKLAQRAFDLSPADPSVNGTLGWVYYRKGKYRDALPYLQSSMAKEPTPLRQLHLGMAYLELGDKSQGMEAISAALRKDPSLSKMERDWK
jgi:Tfp pilus assembly protein PilF